MPSTVQFRNAQTIDRILPNIDKDMARRNITLRQMCHVNDNSEGDSFVGVKADTNGLKTRITSLVGRISTSK